MNDAEIILSEMSFSRNDFCRDDFAELNRNHTKHGFQRTKIKISKKIIKKLKIKNKN
jgi:hypothetical protein